MKQFFQILGLFLEGLFFNLLIIFVSSLVLETAWSGTIAKMVDYQLPRSAAVAVVIFAFSLKGLFNPEKPEEGTPAPKEAFIKIFTNGLSRLVNLIILQIMVICATLLFGI